MPSDITVPDNSDDDTTPTLPKSATAIFINPIPTLLPRSATTIFTVPAQSVAAAPKALLSTLFEGLKHAAKAVVGRRKKVEKPATSQTTEEAKEECEENIDEWEEVDGDHVRDDMRKDQLRLRWQREHNVLLGTGGEDEHKDKGHDPEPGVSRRRRRVRHWDSESEDEGEVIEVV
ncbi:uncharacterized protein N0V89_004879 [Didymosphaeria variabile]|uniref:Uncharacterized protein n=1 Tax=Didymosphaeria variabile TaxID=1932322 RepID=A0A9W8XR88_9PLEO|nr:uncharacterized protein N0V89_004879 [Didymosphaeria variabile]KAJ4356842.1 hypothetical protein N0V89_004879 [Didymosphaeria variabile]